MSLRVLVTGGSRGLGRALCLAYKEAGARVAFTYRKNADDAAATCALLGADALALQGDVADAAHAQATVAAMAERFGGIDVLVNNAASMQVVPMALLEEQDWDRTFATNVKGAYLFARAAMKHMLRARRGHIVNIGSFGADRVVEAPVHYAATKAALHGFSTALAKEVGRYGIAVNYVAPGLLGGGIAARLPPHRIAEFVEHCSLGRQAELSEIAAFVVWLTSEENSFMTGAKLVIDGGL